MVIAIKIIMSNYFIICGLLTFVKIEYFEKRFKHIVE